MIRADRDPSWGRRRFTLLGAKLASCLQIADVSGAALPLGGLAILEACCFVGAAGGVAGAVRVSAGASQHSAIDDQVLLTYRTAIEPSLQDLTCSGRIARLRRE